MSLAALLQIGPSSTEPIPRRLTRAVIAAISDGLLAPGMRLPASRVLAADLGIGRNGVIAAYEQLAAEGYVETRTGAGTFVAADLPDRLTSARPWFGPKGDGEAGPSRRRLAARALDLLAGIGRIDRDAPVRPFAAGLPASDAFPWDAWARTLRRRWRRPGPLASGQDMRGYEPLRREIAAFLALTRAVRCSPDEVVVTSGARQSLDLAVRLLLEPSDAVVVEDPGYPNSDGVLQLAGASVVPVPVDGEGLDVDLAARRCPAPRLILTTPSRNHPLGISMSAARRFRLLEWARSADAWIVEDDFDSEFRFEGAPLGALHGLDTDGRVLYAGTFSRLMFPGLRLGYLVVPPDLAPPVEALRAVTEGPPNAVTQAALADFFAEGRVAGHLRAMRGLYAERCRALAAALRKGLGDRIVLGPADGGLHLTAFLPEGTDDVLLVSRLAEAGITARPLSRYYHEAGRPGLVLGFAAHDIEAIGHAAGRLCETVAAFLDRQS